MLIINIIELLVCCKDNGQREGCSVEENWFIEKKVWGSIYEHHADNFHV